MKRFTAVLEICGTCLLSPNIHASTILHPGPFCTGRVEGEWRNSGRSPILHEWNKGDPSNPILLLLLGDFLLILSNHTFG
jgi:hypothetical protein